MSNRSKQLIDSFVDKSTKLEIKDDKDIDKRNLNEIKYSFDLKFS
jgi:hypothetical protein